jgi:hypothetical protein
MKPKTLPPDLALAELRWMLGDLTRARISQLEKAGIVTRTERGRYSLDSVPRFLKLIKDAGSGPKELQDAKLELLVEKVLMARLERERMEGKFGDLDALDEKWKQAVSMTVSVTRAHLLAVPSKYAPRLIMKQTPAEVFVILNQGIREALENLVINGPEDAKRLERGEAVAHDEESNDAEDEDEKE